MFWMAKRLAHAPVPSHLKDVNLERAQLNGDNRKIVTLET